ncbi:juvenile hormone acid O-methyltransferase-like isoform X2 [Vespa mandarinia]|uniref:juvenile hormone acid O-methyltransferase-like isoform X2 n=1 Tax=Vespa mandarinia TaxID=7446 RepID=UPI00160A44C4|nr:juvenile hormone acid O-methyltransferase-like isoform X2 [Vespa mandarinia]
MYVHKCTNCKRASIPSLFSSFFIWEKCLGQRVRCIKMEKVDEYLNASKLQYHDTSEIVEEFDKELREMHGRCIDLGCGPGQVTVELILPRLPRESVIIGVDVSNAMLEHATKNYRENPRLSFLHLDIETSNLPQEQIARYDNAVSFYCLHWCHNTRLAFENIFKLLRPGGKALIMFLAYNDGFDAYVRIHENPRYQPYMQDAHKFVPYFHRSNDSRGALRSILEDIGFNVLHCSKREKSFVYQNIQSLKKHALAVNPFISRIPEGDLKEEFEDILIREIISRKILFPNKADKCQQEYSVLDRYHILVTYMEKPYTNVTMK